MPFNRQAHVSLGLIPPGEHDEKPPERSFPVSTYLAPEMTDEIAPEPVLGAARATREECLRLLDAGERITSVSRITGVARSTIAGYVRQRSKPTPPPPLPPLSIAVPKFSKRQKLLTPEKMAQLRFNLQAGVTQYEAAKIAGIGRRTLQDWKKKGLI